jgi:hypothetical protein
MPTYNDPAVIESICYDIRLSDYVRGKNRARINDLMNGVKPFPDDDEHKVNVNFLEGTALAHDARSQLSGLFLKPGRFFSLTTDGGRRDKRSLYNSIVTKEMNRVMKRSLHYFECFRGRFAMDILHGIGPAAWHNSECWCPEEVGIEDVGIPANTRLSMRNLPFFYLYRSYTVPEIKKLIRNEKEAAQTGWDIELVNKCIEWVDKQSTQLMGSNWPEIWSPEKVAERVKGDGGFYSTDQVPTIDCFDFYFWSDEDGEEGWRRRIILDAWSTPSGQSATTVKSLEKKKDSDFMRGTFLFNPKNRVYASKLSEIVSFQFADLSSVAPFRYHSVRSLGFLVYAACHLQNRMRCRFTEAAFESAMQYFRVNSNDQNERALKVDLIDKGIIDSTVQFVPQAERWQYNENMMELFMKENRALIDRHTSSYTAQAQNSPGDRKTKFQVMAEQSQATALVTSALSQAYKYQEYEYLEVKRRFMIANSTDSDVRDFRAKCLSQGVPEGVLVPQAWDVDPERVLGAGNKTMEMSIAEQLMQMRHLYDPEPQRQILRRVTTAVTDDPDWSLMLVPEQPLKVSDSVHDAQLSMGTLMAGYQVAIKTGQNHKEYIMVLMSEMGQEIQGIEQSKGMCPPEKIKGFQNVAQNIQQHLQLLAQDEEEKEFVTAVEKQLAKIMNLVRAFQQRLEQQQKKQQQQQGGDPAAQAKVQATVMTAKVKVENSKQAAAQKLAQRKLQFEQELKMQQAKTAHEIHRENLKAIHEHSRNGGGE